MKKLCYDVSLMMVKLLNIILVTVPFALCWFGYYEKRAVHIFYGRGNCAIVILFAVLYAILTNIYDALLISYNQFHESIYSLVLSLLLSDGFMFLALWLLSQRFPNPLPAIVTFAVQAIFAGVWTFCSQKWYFSSFPAQKTAVIYDTRHGLEQLVDKYELNRKFDIRAVSNIDECLDDIHMLDSVEAVFLSGVHSHERNILLKYCIAHDISVYVIPRIGDTLMSSAKRMHLFHLPVLRVERYRPQPVYAAIKRLFDVIFSLLAIVVLSPAMLITAIAIKVTDGGPVLYKQARLTKDGKVFNILKFRSMRVDAEKDGVARLSSGDKDDRITPVGRIIRKCRVDELPQLFCILSGSMSIVGPRPERPEIVAQYEKEIPEFSLRLQAKAGLTGYAQVFGKYNATPYDKLQMDLMYIGHASVLEDMKIIFATVKILFQPESTEGIAEGAVTAIGAGEGRSKAENQG